MWATCELGKHSDFDFKHTKQQASQTENTDMFADWNHTTETINNEVIYDNAINEIN